MGVISSRKRAGPGDDWPVGPIRVKPLKVVAIALANRMARAVRAMLRKGAAWRAA
jgi:transposase